MSDDVTDSPAEATGEQSQSGVLIAQAKAKEQQRLQLWKSRVGLVKLARALMTQKKFSEAAVSYEKYLRILEIVFSCKKGERLTPDHFRESARTSELTVIVSVYWDLMRIYDSSPKYNERQMLASEQLSKFLRFTTIYPDIIRKAEQFAKSAKNPHAFKTFLKMANSERPRCFIATSAFIYPEAPEIIFLRNFRDQKLKTNFLGRKFILIYYRYSPRIACLMDKQKWMKPPVRQVLRLLIKCVSN